MKKTLVIIAAVAIAAGAFAQGKINVNNVGHDFVFGTTGLKAADAGLAGQLVPNTVLPSGVSLSAALWAGTASNSLSLVTLSGLPAPNTAVAMPFTGTGAGAGQIQPYKIQLYTPAINGGVTAYFQVGIYDSSYASYSDALGKGYTGISQVFSAVTQAGISYPNLTTSLDWTQSSIVVSVVPEPTTAAIAGLGLASMLIFRRKKA